jgi:hypothetical protein
MGATPTVPELVRVNLQLESAKLALRAWADSQALRPDLADDVLVALFRDWAAEEKDLWLAVSRTPAGEGYAARWTGPAAPEADALHGRDMTEVRVRACGTLVRSLA